MPLEKKWRNETNPLGPPAEPTAGATPVDAAAIEDLEARANAAFDGAGAAVAEETRAKAAEAEAAKKAENLKDLANVATARTNLGLGSAATHASTDFDIAGLAVAEETRAKAAEVLLAPSLPGQTVVPLIAANLLDTVHTLATANSALFVRCVMPATGTLKDISAFIAVKAGNVILGVYDLGVASAGKYTRLKVSGSIELTKEGEWVKLWESPGLAVTKGQQLMLAINFSSSSAKYGQTSPFATAGASKLPSGFLGSTGITVPQLCGTRAVGSFALPETLEEGLLATSTTSGIILIARVE